MHTNELVEWHYLLDEWLKIRDVNFLLGKEKELMESQLFVVDQDGEWRLIYPY